MHATVCATCSILVPDAERAQHRRLHESRRTTRRATTEPWRALYRTSAWRIARAAVLRRDEHRCRGADNGIRCDETSGLQVDHRVKLRDLWEQHGETINAAFIRAATAVELLVTLCPAHHAAVERARS